MRNIQLQEAFEIEINKLDDGLTKPKSSDTEYFLNVALDKYWKTRYSQNNYKMEGFEQTQKRVDDLRTLVKEVTYTNEISKITNALYTVELPNDYIILLGDTAGIAPADGYTDPCWELDEDGNPVVHYSDTIEGQIETIDRIKENSLSEYRLKYTKAKPIRLVMDDKVYLHTDGKYKVAVYTMQYLRKPKLSILKLKQLSQLLSYICKIRQILGILLILKK